ncbi:aspartate/glutamate racemase family protein [Roseibium sp.]|uniref:aspartate/glutamate racemase family protein n=1 Tax=Roseibium sp. TaxID=1936156 RepID=UPI003A975AB9
MQEEPGIHSRDRHILVVNPNTTASMTEKIGEAARAAAGSGIRITAINPDEGPAAIQGPADGAAALPGLFALIEAQMTSNDPADAIVIACFDDTGLWELKRRWPVPVIGIGEAAYHVAALASQRFSVVTTLSVSVPVLEQNLTQIGLAPRCAKVRASEVPVLDLEDPASDARAKVEAEIERAIAEDEIGAMVLGCAGMADLAEDLSRKFSMRVIDGVSAAVRLAELLVGVRPG